MCKGSHFVGYRVKTSCFFWLFYILRHKKEIAMKSKWQSLHMIVNAFIDSVLRRF